MNFNVGEPNPEIVKSKKKVVRSPKKSTFIEQDSHSEFSCNSSGMFQKKKYKKVMTSTLYYLR